MRLRHIAIGALGALALAGAGGVPALADDPDVDLGHQVLPANDGWASFSTGTTGGAAADAAHVFTVTNRSELIEALGGDNKKNGTNATPKIIQVQGTIDGNVDDANQPVSCAAYADPAFTLDAYLAQFDPAVWGKQPVAGPLEDARKRSESTQAARIQIRVGPNTTIVGLGHDAKIIGVNLFVQNVDNVIIRNIDFENAFDCFPAWDPNDGATGNWNSAFDNISLRGATHVWVDHASFTDGAMPDSQSPTFFGRPFQQHDGELDITNASDLVTVSWSSFRDHDKTMLIGSSDTTTADTGKLRVTVHHDLFANVLERAPRVRFGQVHVFNNLYVVPDPASYVYSWGVGIQSQTFVQNNFFATDPGVDPARFITVFKGTTIHAEGTLVNGLSRHDAVDVVAAYNAANDPDLSTDVGWTPTLFRRVDPTQAVPVVVGIFAGAGRLPT
jgi:pectate lyase